MTNLANMLRLYRKVNDLTLEKLSEQTKLSKATLNRIENGKYIDLTTWFKLTDWLFKES